MPTRHAITPQEASRIAEYVQGFPLPFTLTISEGKPRTLSQNSLIHKWYGEIADYLGDVTPSEIKGQFHHKYALPVRLADPKFAWVWERSGALLDYENQCKALGSGTFGVTSKMSAKELTKYMDEIQRDCAENGIRLTDPEGRNP